MNIGLVLQLKFILVFKQSFAFSLQEETVLDILGLSHQYGFEELESAICDYLKDTLSINNVCLIYDMASLYSLKSLICVCLQYMDKNASPILVNESFYSLSPVSIINVTFLSSQLIIMIYQHNKPSMVGFNTFTVRNLFTKFYLEACKASGVIAT